MTIHKLKQNIEFFEAVKNGTKDFEIRENDRDFQVGDILELRAWTKDSEKYQTWGKGCYLSFGTMEPSKPLFGFEQTFDDGVSEYFPVPSEEMADVIIAKVTAIWTIDTMFTEDGYVDDIENAINLDMYEQILNDYFESDTLPIGCVVMAIEVVG